MPLLFVYGTLRAGESNDIASVAARAGLAPPQWLGAANGGGHLVDFGPYPGWLTPEAAPHSAADLVHGDLYEIDASLLPWLDAVEEVDHPRAEFQRLLVQVLCAAGPLVCLAYPAIAARCAGLPRIPGGDWVRYRRERDGS